MLARRWAWEWGPRARATGGFALPGRDPLAHPERLIRTVYAYVAYRIGDGPQAEDVTSEVFERALRYRASYDPSRGTPTAWLLAIARRCLASRREDGAAPLLDDERRPSGEDVELEITRRLDLRDAVAALSERDRELVALRYGADLTAAQIGELLEMGTNAVEVALHRALGRLRRLMGEEGASSAWPVQPVPARPRQSRV